MSFFKKKSSGHDDNLDHIADDISYNDLEDDCDERLDAYNAALIWLSNGQDEDYTFGYSEEELEDALR